MNHPTREEWMAYLYKETPQTELAALEQHLQSCTACRNEVANWRKTMRGLEAWKLPVKSQAIPFVAPVLKWGIAALFAVGLGYGLGRFSAPAPDVDTLRAGIENSLRASLIREVPAQLREQAAMAIKTEWAEVRAQLLDQMEKLAADTVAESDEQTRSLFSAYDAALKALDSKVTQHATDLATLRKDTETVALLTEYGFRRNQQQMVRLANFNQSAGPSSDGLRPQIER